MPFHKAKQSTEQMGSTMDQQQEKISTYGPHIAVVSSPGMGHIIPVAELCCRLHLRHGLSITLITQTIGQDSKAQESLTKSLPQTLNLISIPAPPENPIPFITQHELLILSTVNYNLPHIREVLRSLKPSALIVDLFSTAVMIVAHDLNVPVYFYYTYNCMATSLNFHFLSLDSTYKGEFRDMPEPVQLPSCVPLHGKDFPVPLQDRGSEMYAWYLRFVKLCHEAKGILVNSFKELEPGAVGALKENPCVPPIYTVGPIVSAREDSGDDHECLAWLDMQPLRSVLYISFGSGGTLTNKQTKELAQGLEMAGERFLWVARPPHDGIDASTAYFSSHGSEDKLNFLSEGFRERTKGFGLVVPSWVPQTKVLSHKAVAGFVTHCGWSSVLESIVNGVPLIAWPLYAEQRMNAVMLSEGVKIALRPREGEGGLVEKEEVSRVIKCLMKGEEGESLRARIAEVKDAAKHACEEGGSSTESLSLLISEWKHLQQG